MNAEITQAIDEARKIIYGDREQTYGKPSKNLDAIGQMWSTYLSSRYDTPVLIEAHDVCMMMALLKIAREAHQRKHDNVVDGIGYLALTDRIKEQ